ncbi:MAG: rhodanese-like domain-containing protein [Bacilli bacterium]|nr:rhodanese-like domain-containing protein [Bacilli bacterium]
MQISINDLLNLKNINIIDIRDRVKYNLGHIPGSINISYYELLNNTSKYLDKDKTYYLYCDFGNTSRVIVSRLNSNGYKTISISGGYNNYLLR